MLSSVEKSAWTQSEADKGTPQDKVDRVGEDIELIASLRNSYDPSTAYMRYSTLTALC